MGHVAIFATSMLSFLFGMLFAWAAVQFGPNVSAIVPVSLAFIMTGGLGVVVMAAVKDQGERLRALEQRAEREPQRGSIQ